MQIQVEVAKKRHDVEMLDFTSTSVVGLVPTIPEPVAGQSLTVLIARDEGERPLRRKARAVELSGAGGVERRFEWKTPLPAELVAELTQLLSRRRSASAARASTPPDVESSVRPAVQDDSSRHLPGVIEREAQEVESRLVAVITCRNQVFIATIGAVGACWLGTVAIAANVANTTTPPSSDVTAGWVLAGCLLGHVLLSVGMLATVEKVREINLLRGLSLALEDLARARIDLGGLPYQGWHRLLYAHDECGALQRAGHCRRLRDAADESGERGKRSAHAVRCWAVGLVEARPFLAKKRIFPGTLSSFSSFMAFVYLVLYVVVGTVALFFGGKWMTLEIDDAEGVVLLCYVIGASLGLAVFGAQFQYRRHRIDQSSSWVKIVVTNLGTILIVGSGVVACFAAVAPLFPSFASFYEARAANWFQYLGLAGLAAYPTWFGAYLAEHLIRCRRGYYSVEARHMAWAHVIRSCRFDLRDHATPAVCGHCGASRLDAP